MTWKAKLQSHGLTEETAPNLVKKVIAERREIEREADELKRQLASGELSENKTEEVRGVLEEVPDALKEVDAKIMKKIEYWEKMKDTWAATAERFGNKKGKGRPPKNKAEAGQQIKEQAAERTQTQQPPIKEVIELEAEEIKPAKKSGFGKIGLFLLLGVLSFGAYNYLKNND